MKFSCAAYPSIFQSFNTAYFKVNMNSKWTLFTFLTHIPGLIVHDSTVQIMPSQAQKKKKKTRFFFDQTVACSASETTFHFG